MRIITHKIISVHPVVYALKQIVALIPEGRFGKNPGTRKCPDQFGVIVKGNSSNHLK